MTDAERNEYFDRKKKEIMDRLLGPGTLYPIPDPITVRYTAPSNGKLWYDRPRILKNMNIDTQCQKYLAWYNDKLRQNNGVIVTYAEESSLDAEVPPPVK